MLQDFRKAMRKLAGRPEGPILLACSGGSDSMALAELSAEAAKIEGWTPILAHLDHGLRAGSGEREHLAAWAERRDIELVGRKLDLPESLRKDPGNLEARARELRYGALEEVARETGAKTVLTGHTADDQAETLWLWLLRGTGLRGLRGIAPTRPISEGSEIQLVRPLLDCTRVQLRDYLTERGLAWLEDPSNADKGFRRNRIRHELLPFLRERFEIDPVPPAARLGCQARELSDFLDREIAERGLTPAAERGRLRLDRRDLKDAPAALASWAVSAALAETGSSGHFKLARILELNRGEGTGKTIELGEGRFVRFTPEHIYLGSGDWTPEDEIPRQRLEAGGLTLPGSGELRIGDWILRIRELPGPADPPTGPARALFDRGGLKEPMRLVNPRPGMRIRPLGAGGAKSLADLLIDRKVPRQGRGDLLVLLDAEDQLLWVAGIARGAQAPLRAKTKLSLALDLERASS